MINHRLNGSDGLLILALLAVAFPGPVLGEPNVCTVNDPTGTLLNVRATPGGKVVGQVHNGRALNVVASAMVKGQPWAKVVGWTDGDGIQPAGWVFARYLSCETLTNTLPTQPDIQAENNLLALFSTATFMESGQQAATPIACRHNQQWVSERQDCLKLLPLQFRLSDADIAVRQTDQRDSYGQEVILLSGTSDVPDVFIYGAEDISIGSLCGVGNPQQSQAITLAPPFSLSKALITSLDAPMQTAFNEIMSATDLTAGSSLLGDFDGDGDIDRLVSVAVTIPQDGADGWNTEGYLTLAVWHGGEQEVVGYSAYDPFIPEESRCFDLDGNGKVEVLFAEGGEMERSYRYLEWDGAEFQPVGFVLAGGD